MPFPQASDYGSASSGKLPYTAFFEALIEYLLNRRGPQNQRSALYMAKSSNFTDTEKPFNAANAVKISAVGSGDGERLRIETGRNTCDAGCPAGWTCSTSGDNSCAKTVLSVGNELQAALSEAYTYLTTTGDSKGSGSVQIYAYVTPRPPTPPRYEGRVRLPDPPADDNRGMVSDDFGALLESIAAESATKVIESGLNPTLVAMQERLSLSAGSGAQHYVYIVPTDVYDAKQFAGDSSDATECLVTSVDSQGNVSNIIDETTKPAVCACLRIVRNATNFGGFAFSAERGRPGSYRGLFVKAFVPDSEFDMPIDATFVDIEPCPPTKGCPQGTGWRSDCVSGAPSACRIVMQGDGALEEFLLDAIAYFGADKQLSLLYYPGSCQEGIFKPSTDYIDDAAALVLEKLTPQQREAYANRNVRDGTRTPRSNLDNADSDTFDDPNNAKKAGLNSLEIVLIVAGSILALLLVIVGVYVALRKQEEKQQMRQMWSSPLPTTGTTNYF